MDLLMKVLSLFSLSGFNELSRGNVIMIIVGGVLLYFAIVKKCEPLLLLPIGFGAVLVNLPLTGIMEEGGLLYFISFGIRHEIFPCLIFMGIGAMTDFGPLLANPITFLLGAAAQVGVFIALIGAVLLGFNIYEAASIGIIGGADGPTAIYLTVKMAPQLLGAIAVAAYSYMSLVPIIQPPIMKLLTSPEERKIVMKQLRPVSRSERIIFPIISTILIGLLLPASVPIIGMLMLGNLFRESLVVDRLSKTAQNELINIVTIFLATCVGATMQAEYFLTFSTIKIVILGLIAFAFGTAGGVLFGKLLNKITGGNINPLIGAAGVSAVPMAARVAQKVGQEANPRNFLLMHAMGPNVAGVIGTAVAAGVMLTLLQ
ncbi:MAG TPA: glutaconyl-CoA decarboxylase subunit beta [Candidatus Atribacteria bacterium]|nr:glutaconyl-CoA decarboxylase subunit beta [Candidatus Atribacteria bacterium]